MKSTTVIATIAAAFAALATLSTTAQAAYDVSTACDHSTLACEIAKREARGSMAKTWSAGQEGKQAMSKEDTRRHMADKPSEWGAWKGEIGEP